MFEVVAVYPPGHKLEGQPARLGPALPEARRLTLILLNGSLLNVTLHEDEIEGLPARLPELWRRCVAATQWEHDNRDVIGAAKLSPDQEDHHLATMLNLVGNVPVGVLCVERWTDALVRGRRR